MIPYVGRLLLVLSIVVPRRCGPAYDCSTAVFIALGCTLILRCLGSVFATCTSAWYLLVVSSLSTVVA